MRIEAFTIRNYKSIKELKIENLNPVNVFFGKNNVGKSNILRGLHLAFFCLKNDKIFLPDTMFHNRNVYKPVEITIDLVLEDNFYVTEKVNRSLKSEIYQIRSALAYKGEIFLNIEKEVEQFIVESKSFKPSKKFRLKMYLTYNERTSDIGVSIEDLESDYMFEYGKYRILYEKLERTIKENIDDKLEGFIDSFSSQLSLLDLDGVKIPSPTYLSRLRFRDLVDIEVRDIEVRLYTDRLKRAINEIIDPDKRNEALSLFERYEELLGDSRSDLLIYPFSTTFNIVKEYFDKISDNFILIPNKEYFTKGPFVEKNGKQIEIFDSNRFEDKLLSLIESPSKKERPLIQNFNSIWSKSYGDLGELEIC